VSYSQSDFLELEWNPHVRQWAFSSIACGGIQLGFSRRRKRKRKEGREGASKEGNAFLLTCYCSSQNLEPSLDHALLSDNIESLVEVGNGLTARGGGQQGGGRKDLEVCGKGQALDPGLIVGPRPP
jgi:hypothetical protein